MCRTEQRGNRGEAAGGVVPWSTVALTLHRGLIEDGGVGVGIRVN